MNFSVIIVITVVLFLILTISYFQVRDYYTQMDPMIQKLQGIINDLVPGIINKIKIFKGDKSYTINKKTVYLCLEDQNGNYYNLNILVYVLLHEISHVLCKSIGHNEEFQSIFDKLLKKAEEKGYYDPSQKIPSDYCNYNSE
jgi:hypothetical protein